MVSERSSGLNLLKIGSQFPRNPVDHANQRVEEKTKNAVLSKRVRSSVAEIKVCMRKFSNHVLFFPVDFFIFWKNINIRINFHKLVLSMKRS